MAKQDSPGYLSTYLNMGATAHFRFDNGYTITFVPKRKKMRTGTVTCSVTLAKNDTVVGTWDFPSYDKFLPGLKVILQLVKSDVVGNDESDNDTNGKASAWS